MTEITRLPTQEDIDTQACKRIVQLHERKPTQEELRELHDWMNQSPLHHDALMLYARTWDDANVLTNLLGADMNAPEPRRASNGVAFRRSGRELALCASGAVALLICAWTGYAYFFAPFPHKAFTTAIGEQQHISLPDGSKIHLNTHSIVRVRYSREDRDIYLDDGEAMFEVAHDVARPFRVHAAGNIIQAVGTAFSVRVETTSMELVVSEGIVDFIRPSETSVASMPQEASPPMQGQRISSLHEAKYENGALAVRAVDKQSVTRSLSWRDGILAFKGEPLEDVVAEVSRYTSAEFVFENPELRNVRIGGYFNVGRVDGLIIALEGSFGISVRKDEMGRYVLSGGDADTTG